MKISAIGLFVSAAIGATIGATIGSASAATFFEATLSGSQVVPTFDTDAGGFARFELNDTQTELSYFIQLNGLTLEPEIADRTELNDVTRIHLHTGPVGENGMLQELLNS
ncbi:CHRD domain-containing protein [Synechococcus sp. PCC 7336]|uniref:CHRD domain-containing protein n=1 Tax=Synechococcus sp. PCC 7336 TaxID=195250 RepID=UPI00036EABA9|nr:CHRD domain-containing protein [Synechococcus sp. PCC 7336]